MGVDLPSTIRGQWKSQPFGEAIINGSTAVGVTTNTQSPIVRNREPANLTTNSAVLTGQLVDAGLGMIPSDAENASFSPLDYPGLRLWLDVSDADGDGVVGSSYDDANVTQPSDWNPGVLYGVPLHILKDKSGQENDAVQETNASQPGVR